MRKYVLYFAFTRVPFHKEDCSLHVTGAYALIGRKQLSCIVCFEVTLKAVLICFPNLIQNNIYRAERKLI